jgi:hypothetical protein
MRNQNMDFLPGFGPASSAYRYALDYRHDCWRETSPMLAFGVLEWTFTIVLIALVGAAGLFGLFILLQLFHGHSRR